MISSPHLRHFLCLVQIGWEQVPGLALAPCCLPRLPRHKLPGLWVECFTVLHLQAELKVLQEAEELPSPSVRPVSHDFLKDIPQPFRTELVLHQGTHSLVAQHCLGLEGAHPVGSVSDGGVFPDQHLHRDALELLDEAVLHQELHGKRRRHEVAVRGAQQSCRARAPQRRWS